MADRNTLAGVVRAHGEAKTRGFRFLVGCRLEFTDGAELIVYPRDRAAYGRLCRLLSLGKSGIGVAEPSILEGTLMTPPPGWGRGRGGGGALSTGCAVGADLCPSGCSPTPIPDPSPIQGEGRIAKGETRLTFEDAAMLGEGLIALARAPERIDDAFEARLAAWRAAWPDELYLAAAPLHRGDDRARLNRLAAIAERTGAPLVAVNAVLHHQPERRRLQDVLTCIREGVTIDDGRLSPAGQRRAVPESPRRDGAAVRRPRSRPGAHGRDRRAPAASAWTTSATDIRTSPFRRA